MKFYNYINVKKYILTISNLVFVNLFPVITQLLILKIISTNITTSEFGLFTLLLTFNILITQIFSNGLISVTARFFDSPNYNVDLFFKNYLSIFLINFVVITMISLILFIIFYFNIGLSFSVNFLIIVITSIFDIFFQTYISLNNKINRRDRVILFSFLYNFFKIFGVCFIYFMGLLNIRSILIIYLLGTLIIDFILFILKSDRILKFKFKFNLYILRDEMFDYVKPFYVTGLFSFLFFVVDKWIIGLFLNNHFLGVYSVFYQIGYAPFTYLALIFTMLLSPIIFNKVDADNSFLFNINDLITPFILFVIIVVAVSYLFKDYIVLLLSDIKYLNYSYFIVYMAISGCFFLLTQILNLFFLAKKQVYLLTKIQFLGSFFSILSLIFFLKYLPHSYLPISFVLTNLFIVFLMYYFYYAKIDSANMRL